MAMMKTDLPGLTRNPPLRMGQRIKLILWAQKESERLHREKPTHQEAAEQATEAMGMPISKGQIKAVFKDLGMTWLPANFKGNAIGLLLHEIKAFMADADQRITSLKEEATALKSRLEAAEATVVRFVTSTGAEAAHMRGIVVKILERLGIKADGKLPLSEAAFTGIANPKK